MYITVNVDDLCWVKGCCFLSFIWYHNYHIKVTFLCISTAGAVSDQYQFQFFPSLISNESHSRLTKLFFYQKKSVWRKKIKIKIKERKRRKINRNEERIDRKPFFEMMLKSFLWEKNYTVWCISLWSLIFLYFTFPFKILFLPFFLFYPFDIIFF